MKKKPKQIPSKFSINKDTKDYSLPTMTENIQGFACVCYPSPSSEYIIDAYVLGWTAKMQSLCGF